MRYSIMFLQLRPSMARIAGLKPNFFIFQDMMTYLTSFYAYFMRRSQRTDQNSNISTFDRDINILTDSALKTVSANATAVWACIELSRVQCNGFLACIELSHVQCNGFLACIELSHVQCTSSSKSLFFVSASQDA